MDEVGLRLLREELGILRNPRHRGAGRLHVVLGLAVHPPQGRLHSGDEARGQQQGSGHAGHSPPADPVGAQPPGEDLRPGREGFGLPQYGIEEQAGEQRQQDPEVRGVPVSGGGDGRTTAAVGGHRGQGQRVDHHPEEVSEQRPPVPAHDHEHADQQQRRNGVEHGDLAGYHQYAVPRLTRCAEPDPRSACRAVDDVEQEQVAAVPQRLHEVPVGVSGDGGENAQVQRVGDRERSQQRPVPAVQVQRRAQSARTGRTDRQIGRDQNQHEQEHRPPADGEHGTGEGQSGPQPPPPRPALQSPHQRPDGHHHEQPVRGTFDDHAPPHPDLERERGGRGHQERQERGNVRSGQSQHDPPEHDERRKLHPDGPDHQRRPRPRPASLQDPLRQKPPRLDVSVVGAEEVLGGQPGLVRPEP